MKIKRFNESQTDEEYLISVDELRDIFIMLIDDLEQELDLEFLYLSGSNGDVNKTTGDKDILDKKFESVTVCIPYDTNVFKNIEPGYKTSFEHYKEFNSKIYPIVDYIESQLIEKDYSISISGILEDDYIMCIQVDYLYL